MAKNISPYDLLVTNMHADDYTDITKEIEDELKTHVLQKIY